MMDQQLVKILQDNGQYFETCLHYCRIPPYKIRFVFPNQQEMEFNGHDLFECLISLRRELETRNWKILCNGSRIDVNRSGMSSQMSGGTVLYVMKQLGEQAKFEDNVYIFDECDPELIATVAEQEKFRDTWFDSLE
jgi:hypothetical protein